MNTGQTMIKIFATIFAGILCVTIIGGIISALFWGFYTGGKQNMKTYNFSETYQGIDTIDINSAVNNIIICSGNEFRVDMENVRVGCTAKAEGNVFMIEDNDFSNGNFFDMLDKFSGKRNTFQRSRITITVPESTVLKDVDIESGAGVLKFYDITSKRLNIQSGAGEIEGDNLNAEDVRLSNGAGTIDFRKVVFMDTKINAGAGEVFINGKLLGRNDIQCGVGSLTLNLEDSQDDYNLQIEKGLGSILVDGNSHFNISNYKNAENDLMIKGGVGMVEVNFERR